MVDFRNKYLLNTVRIVFGLFMLFSGVAGFLSTNSTMEGIPAPLVTATQSLMDMGIFQMIKVTEIVAGLMLVVGFLPALATIFLAPVGVGIVVFNARVALAYSPVGLVMGVVVCLFEIYLGYAYWKTYKPLFKRK